MVALPFKTPPEIVFKLELLVEGEGAGLFAYEGPERRSSDRSVPNVPEGTVWSHSDRRGRTHPTDSRAALKGFAIDVRQGDGGQDVLVQARKARTLYPGPADTPLPR